MTRFPSDFVLARMSKNPEADVIVAMAFLLSSAHLSMGRHIMQLFLDASSHE